MHRRNPSNDPAVDAPPGASSDDDPIAGVEIVGAENILTLQLLQQTVGFSPAVVDATSRWWEQTATPGQELPRFLMDQGVFRADAPDAIERVARGEIEMADAQDLFTLYGLDSLKRCLSAHTSRSPAAARRPRPRRVPHPTVRTTTPPARQTARNAATSDAILETGTTTGSLSFSPPCANW